MQDKFNLPLFDSIKKSIASGNFSSSDFFLEWFKNYGKSYFFLFKKNLKVTNIQFAELISLLRTHMSISGGSEVHNQLQFVSQSEFKDTMQSIMDSLVLNNNFQDNHAKLFIELYSDLLSKTVIVDPFFGSCAVYIPINLSLDISLICSEAGYIHSCGKNIFIRNMLKATYDELVDSIDHHLEMNYSEKKIFFTVYAHEDFTQFDREIQNDLKSGLDDSKIYLEKVDFGSDTLVTILRKMKQKYHGKLEIPNPGNFKTVHKEFRSHENVDSSRTMWMITDRSIGAQLNQPGKVDYFIVYEQEYLNENPFHIFDENKPAWLDHTTIPHTLAGAMINITRPWKKKNIFIKDPFVGSGTIYLESMKYPSVTPLCSDLNPYAYLITQDNIEFFALSTDQLNEYLVKISFLIKYIRSSDTVPENASGALPKEIDSYVKIKNFLYFLYKNNSDLLNSGGVFNPKHLAELSKFDYFDRLLFYISLRTWKRNLTAFKRESKVWNSAFIYELSSLKSQIEDLFNLREKENKGVIGDEKGSIKVTIYGNYSLSTTFSCTQMKDKSTQTRKNFDQRADVRRIKPNSCDIIITDPPYGFNTSDKVDDLAKLYKKMIEKLILALKKDGHLVFCLPYHSRIGRRLKYFSDYGLIVHQIMATAESLNREVIYSASVVPTPQALFRPPFYWESERALGRKVLHFRIK